MNAVLKPAGDAVPVEAGDVLGTEGRKPWWRRPGLWTAAACAALLLVGVSLWQQQRVAKAGPHYVTEAVTRGRLVVTVTANGTLQPTNKVDIGSELSGTVARVLVDVNDRVAQGQLLAELDTSKLQGQVERSRASVQVAQARLAQALATRDEARGNLQRLQEVARLSGGQVPSQAEMASGRAAVARAEADEASAHAAVADARAALGVDETNLRKASIRSPIRGVVLSRSVDPGNAVAASLQAVTLFTLAEDLKQMKLEVNIDEADVGQVREGQRASFTVSAYPNRNYPATISRVNYGSTINNNVVTYVAELSVGNDDLTLRPGMTATAVVTTQQRDDVLLVPNAALRFTPRAASPGASAPQSAGGLVSRLLPRMPAQAPRRAGTRLSQVHQLWLLKDGKPVAVAVQVGATDGRMTEVSGEGLAPGAAAITEEASGATP